MAEYLLENFNLTLNVNKSKFSVFLKMPCILKALAELMMESDITFPTTSKCLVYFVSNFIHIKDKVESEK